MDKNRLPRLYSSNSQWIATISLTRISGVLSMLGSCAILYLILSKAKRKLQQRHNRLLVGTCIFEIFYSSALTASTAALPREVATMYSIYGVRGNARTCQVQGFLIQLGCCGTLLYLSSLSLHYLLTIRYRVDEEFISKKIEPWMHAISITIPFTTSITALCLGLYHHKYSVCWIAAKPFGCTKLPATCEAAANAPYFEFFFGYLWFFLSAVIQVLSMLLIYRTVRQREKIMESYALRGTNGQILVHSSSQIAIERRDTAIQSILTISTPLLTITWPLVADISATWGSQVSVPFLFISNTFTPLLGFMNFIVYIRPRYLSVRRTNPQQSFWGNMKMVMLDKQACRRLSNVPSTPISRRRSISSPNMSPTNR